MSSILRFLLFHSNSIRRRKDPALPKRLDCKKLFRFSVSSLAIVVNDLAPLLKPISKNEKPVPIYIQVFATLHYLATGCFQITIGKMFNVDQSCVSKIYWKVIKAIVAK